MERVVGIGGVFIKSKDPGALREWYRVHLGMDIQAADKLAETLLAKGCVTQFKLLAERLAPDD